MSIHYRKTLIASMVAALVGAPVWVAAAGDYGSTGQSSTEQQTRGRSDTDTGMQGSPQSQEHAQSSTQMQTSSQLTSMTPNDLQGKKVVGTNGEDVGKVKAIVSSRTQDKPFAVISAGGFLGIGDKEIVVSLDKLQLSGDQLQVSATKEELTASPEYMRDQYVEVKPEDQPISEFSAFEADKTSPAASPDTGRVHKSPSGKELDPADPRQSSDIAPDRGDTPERKY